MPQTSVLTEPTAAFAGMLGDLATKYSRSYVNEEASAEIPFGVMVKEGTDAGAQCKLASAATVATMLGVVVHRHDYAVDTELGDDGLKPTVTCEVLQQGVVWVVVEEAVAVTDPVWVRVTAAGAEVYGAFRNDTDGGDCLDISSFARWLKGSSGAGVALLQIDMLNRKEAAAD